MRPLGLYLHWPYCARICPYCDFAVAKNRAVDEALWANTFREDLRLMAELAEPRPLASIYFGGGTPSLMPPGVAEAVLEEAERLFGLAPTCERTIEANPDDRASFSVLGSLGFERLSLGVQSLRDEALRFLGRNHDAVEARLGIEEALEAFRLVSIDLIYARPRQKLAAWEEELAEAASLGANHLSLYQLTIEEGTAFGRAARRGSLRPMPDERAALFYERTQEMTKELGMPAYEVSNHARPGEEAVHNGLYWHDADWIAIGPGAHGRVGSASERLATAGSTKIASYTQTPLEERIAVERISRRDALVEAVAGGLRPTEGLDLARLGPEAETVLRSAAPLVEEGYLFTGGGRLAATPTGRLLLDYLTSILVEELLDDASSSV